MIKVSAEPQDLYNSIEVINAIEVTNGDAKEIFDSIRGAESLLDFNQLIPMPKDIETAGADVRKRWRLENWGTTSNVIDAEDYGIDHGKPVEILFRTAWTRPELVFEALARKYPKHELVMHSTSTRTAKSTGITASPLKAGS